MTVLESTPGLVDLKPNLEAADEGAPADEDHADMAAAALEEAGVTNAGEMLKRSSG